MNNQIFHLEHLTSVHISGNDALDFLQGQFTNDMNSLNDNRYHFGAWCDPKGRVLANFIIFKSQEAYQLIFSSDLKETIISRLKMYVLRADVAIAEMHAPHRLTGLLSEDIDSLELNPVHEQGELIHVGESVCLILNSEPLRILIFGKEEDLSLVVKNTDNYLKADSATWQCLDIQQGIPWITQNTSGMCLPQELNLDLNDGLSYNKGCFPGQEIISRLHYRGQVKKRLYNGVLLDQPDIHAGMKLFKDSKSNASGFILGSCQQDTTCHILAVTDVGVTADETLHINELPDTDILLQPVSS
jgi:folate-binding protein YgfZ